MIDREETLKKLVTELEKMPNIRYACSKVGIDHSTYYRWLGSDRKIHKAVMLAITLGREKMGDAAEGVIISGIQNNDMAAAKYWLAHNHERYISIERIAYFEHLENSNIEFIKSEEATDPQINAMFHLYLTLERKIDPDVAYGEMRPLIRAHYKGDKLSMDNFILDYEKWKENMVEISPDGSILDSPNQSVINE